jgi:ubiquinone/menaquinone biosynthesis C-methylase UbiE
MAEGQDNYLLAGGAAELERLQLQARVWEPDAEAMLDQIGIESGWRCIDLGCGAMGILGPLSQRAGASGKVVGLDTDAKLLAAARALVEGQGWNNVELLEGDAYHTHLERASFDLVHVRFVFAPVGRDDELINEMYALTRPEGVMVIQEPDAASWNCFPSHPAWDRLKETILAAFVRGGGDFNVGQRTYNMLRQAGLEDVELRAGVVPLPPGHPYLRLPIQFATSLRPRILDGGLLSEGELDEALAECERIAQEPETIGLTFVVTQVWGRKPQGG